MLSAVILAGALIVAGSNWVLVRSLRDELRARARGAGATTPGSHGGADGSGGRSR